MICLVESSASTNKTLSCILWRNFSHLTTPFEHPSFLFSIFITCSSLLITTSPINDQTLTLHTHTTKTQRAVQTEIAGRKKKSNLFLYGGPLHQAGFLRRLYQIRRLVSQNKSNGFWEGDDSQEGRKISSFRSWVVPNEPRQLSINQKAKGSVPSRGWWVWVWGPKKCI